MKDIIKVDLRKTGSEVTDTELSQDRIQWRTFMNTAMNLQTRKEKRIS
jgi:hypothetical protein